MKVKIDAKVEEIDIESVVTMLRSFNKSQIDEVIILKNKEIIENKNLSDKEICIENPNYSRVYKKEDVKQALKEFTDWVETKYPPMPIIADKLKEIFGGLLT